MTRKRTAPQQLRAQRTRRDLLAAARRAFAEVGYDGATIDDIAEAAGCSKGAYYFHFATKEEALLALIDDWTRERTRALEEASAGDGPPQAGLSALFDTLLNGRSVSRPELRLLLEFWSLAERNPSVARRLAKAQRAWRRLLRPAISRAQQAGALPATVDAETLVDIVLALHDGLVVQAALGRNSPLRKQTDAALALLTGQEALSATG